MPSTIRDGVLSFKAEDFPGTPDYEDPNNRDQRDMEVIVIATATDGAGKSRSRSTPFFVTVAVMDKRWARSAWSRTQPGRSRR